MINRTKLQNKPSKEINIQSNNLFSNKPENLSRRERRRLQSINNKRGHNPGVSISLGVDYISETIKSIEKLNSKSYFSIKRKALSDIQGKLEILHNKINEIQKPDFDLDIYVFYNFFEKEEINFNDFLEKFKIELQNVCETNYRNFKELNNSISYLILILTIHRNFSYSGYKNLLHESRECDSKQLQKFLLKNLYQVLTASENFRDPNKFGQTSEVRGFMDLYIDVYFELLPEFSNDMEFSDPEFLLSFIKGVKNSNVNFSEYKDNKYSYYDLSSLIDKVFNGIKEDKDYYYIFFNKFSKQLQLDLFELDHSSAGVLLRNIINFVENEHFSSEKLVKPLARLLRVYLNQLCIKSLELEKKEFFGDSSNNASKDRKNPQIMRNQAEIVLRILNGIIADYLIVSTDNGQIEVTLKETRIGRITNKISANNNSSLKLFNKELKNDGFKIKIKDKLKYELKNFVDFLKDSRIIYNIVFDLSAIDRQAYTNYLKEGREQRLFSLIEDLIMAANNGSEKVKNILTANRAENKYNLLHPFLNNFIRVFKEANNHNELNKMLWDIIELSKSDNFSLNLDEFELALRNLIKSLNSLYQHINSAGMNISKGEVFYEKALKLLSSKLNLQQLENRDIVKDFEISKIKIDKLCEAVKTSIAETKGIEKIDFSLNEDIISSVIDNDATTEDIKKVLSLPKPPLLINKIRIKERITKPFEKEESVSWIERTQSSNQAFDVNRFNTILKKIAIDLYDYLSNAKFIVPASYIDRSNPKIFLEVIENCEAISEACAVDDKGNILKFIEFLEKAGRPPESITFKNKVYPLRGFMEILAIAKLIGYWNVLGRHGENIGFIIKSDQPDGQEYAKVVIVDIGFAFHRNDEGHLAKTDKLDYPRNIKLNINANVQETIKWKQLLPRQQEEFLEALSQAVRELSDAPTLGYLVFRETQLNSSISNNSKELWELLDLIEASLKEQKKIYQIKLKNLNANYICTSNDNQYIEIETTARNNAVVHYLTALLSQYETRVKENVIKCYKEQSYSLSLGSSNLNSLPNNIFDYFIHLSSLNLSSNELQKLPDSLSKLTNLTSLGMLSNQFSEFPENITNLTKLTSLDLDRNQLSTVPESIGKLVNLSSLDLRSNKFSEFPISITNLSQLRKLYLQSNQLKTIPKNISKLISLSALNLDQNEISEFSEHFTNLTELTELYLSNNQISKLNGIGKLTKLTDLRVNNNQLQTVPEEIGNLANLNYLYLNNNNLKTLPNSIYNLTRLTQLSLENNQLEQLSEDVGNLVNLNYLYLNKNNLKALPTSIANLTKLGSLMLNSENVELYLAVLLSQYKADIKDNIIKCYKDKQPSLDLSNSNLNSLPNNIFDYLTHLTSLNLNHNEFQILPDKVTKLTNLIKLELRSNKFNQFPNNITSLTKLETLDLQYNQLNTLPETMNKFTNLTNLNLRNNNFSEFPDSITNLSKLSTLELQNNQLSAIPENMINLTNLNRLYLNFNKFSEFPENISTLANLTILELQNNQINEFCDIDNLTKLTDLRLSNNKLQDVPDSISDLVNLNRLYLDGNEFKIIPDSVVGVSKLTHLSFTDNQLEEVPDNISELVNLVELKLDKNNLKTVPGSISELTKLKTLDLSSNQLNDSEESRIKELFEDEDRINLIL